VSVGPPLFCKGPRRGSRFFRSELPKPVASAVLPIRLWPRLLKVLEELRASGPVPEVEVLPATMVLRTLELP
jgi:hypothetical protein